MSSHSIYATIAQDGTGTHTNIQDAVNAAPSDSAIPILIIIKRGIYKEVVTINSSKSNLCLVGEDPENTIISYDNFNSKLRPDGSTYGTAGSATVFVYGRYFYAQNITFQNSANPSDEDNGRQAVALLAAADKLIFKHCRFIGRQDSLFVMKGRQYFQDCCIEGDVDFIFGEGPAWLEQCEIKSVYRPGEIKGYITASSTLKTASHGIVCCRCKCTAEEGVSKQSVYLGRAWHPTYFTEPVNGNSVFLHCELGEHIKPAGWTFMRKQYPVLSERLREYKNFGPGADTQHAYRIQLSDDEAEKYSIQQVLGGDDDWNPVSTVF